MAFLPERSRGGFSVVKAVLCLPIFGILALLVVLLYPQVGCGDPFEKTMAKNEVAQLATAIKAFVTEYGRLPTTSKHDLTLFGNEAQSHLMDVLWPPNPKAPPSENPRAIAFLEIPRAKHGLNGRVDDTGPFLDSWGNAYFIRLDADYDGYVANPDNDPDKPKLKKSVIVWSQGDPKKRDAYENPKRWIKSWE